MLLMNGQKISREIQTIKKIQVENTVLKFNKLQWAQQQIGDFLKRVSELEHRLLETIQSEKQKKDWKITNRAAVIYETTTKGTSG